MKCPSIACLWPSSPPSHLITSSLSLPSPPSLYTGASDGSIVFWSLDDPNQIRPLSVLCGHSSPIAALSLSGTDLVSASSDGVLCAWAAPSLRCRLRRRLPPWAGSPTLIRPLLHSAGERHVYVACAGDGDVSSVLVVDSASLNVVRAIAHGAIGIGSVSCMVLVGKDAILVDGRGKVRFLKQEKESEAQDAVKAGPSLIIEGEESTNEARAVAISQDGKLLALIFETRCVFKLVANEVEIGEVSIKNVHPIGAIFLQDDELGTVEKFVVWSSNGAAVVYSMLSLDGVFRFEALCEIPAVEHPLDERSAIHFCQFKLSLVRLESLCLESGDSLLWKPCVEIWPITDGSSFDKNSLSMLLGVGGFPSCPIETKEGSDRSSQQRKVQSTRNGECSNNGVGLDERIVSSSMVLSDDSYAPFAVVYGFYNGEIEVVLFINLLTQANSPSKSIEHHPGSCTSERFFSGHTGAVLCLAARCIAINFLDQRVCRVLISGSTDCTVRIWDLDSGNVLTVLHHHVGPVKQIILPPPCTDHPWDNCLLTVGEDCCVALVSLETLRVERMFPGHHIYPSTVAWDSTRGYVACLCHKNSSSSLSSLSTSDSSSVLYLWDVKSGARERIIRGTASRSMFDHFCRGMNINSITGNIRGGFTSASSLLLPFIDDPDVAQSRVRRNEKGKVAMPTPGVSHRSTDVRGTGKGKLPLQSVGHSSDSAETSSTKHVLLDKANRNAMHPVKSSCPFPGIATLEFDLSSLMTLHSAQSSGKQVAAPVIENDVKGSTLQQGVSHDNSDVKATESRPMNDSLEECLVRFSLSFLHLWDVDKDLDRLIMEDMDVCKPEGFYLASGVLGDRGSLTLVFPGLHATLELWKSSSEFCAMRSLVIVSLAQRMISLSHSSTTASSALAAFYTRNFAEKVPDIKPPLLQLLVSFWQDPSEHVRMAARSLFHCAAPRAIPHALCGHKTVQVERSLNILEEHEPSDKGNACTSIVMDLERPTEIVSSAEVGKSIMVAWLESFEIQEWVSWIEGTNQDAKASHIIVAAALVVWYPSIVKDDLAILVVNQLIKLIMSMNERYSYTAAELLAEGMESTWKACLGPEIPHLIGDIFFQIECLTNTPATTAKPALAVNMGEALVEILLPSLAMADIAGFLNVIEGQIWATSSDSPVHLVSLKTLIRVVRGSSKSLAPYLDKVVNYVLQTMDPGNLVMRKACRNNSMTALREITRIFPMVGMNESSTRLAVGDAVGDIRSVTVRVYDIESVTKIKILDASGPLGLPNYLEGASKTKMATAISALIFSPDSEGLVAFSENGLMIRWWSLGSGWWEKLSRNLVPVQCTKLIFVPPWEGFSPNSSRSSIMASIFGHDKQQNSQGSPRELDEADSLKLLLHNLDLSYRLQWVSGRNVLLTHHGQELGTFPL